LRLAWSGQHIGRKALPILLQALAVLRSEQLKLDQVPRVEVVVLGEGPETERWKAKAQRLGIADCIRWTGMLPHAAALREVAESDAMAFTSIQEGTPHAVLESLSLAVPVLCHDACGMGVAVNDDCGIKLPMIDPASSIAGFADAIRRLALEPGLVDRLSSGALRRAAELSWDNKARHIAERYWQVVNVRPAQVWNGAEVGGENA
jgi:glycosyltransferase involved in cell wall biosynthesis